MNILKVDPVSATTIKDLAVWISGFHITTRNTFLYQVQKKLRTIKKIAKVIIYN